MRIDRLEVTSRLAQLRNSNNIYEVLLALPFSHVPCCGNDGDPGLPRNLGVSCKASPDPIVGIN